MAGGGILALLGGSKGKGGSGKPKPPGLEIEVEGGGGDEVGDALGEMFEALQAGDNSSAALAFKRAYHACADEGASDEPDMELGDEEPELDL